MFEACMQHRRLSPANATVETGGLCQLRYPTASTPAIRARNVQSLFSGHGAAEKITEISK